MKQKHYQDEVTLVLGGSAGQGLQTIETVISFFLHKEGYHIFSSSEYMSRVRGGSNSTEIRVSNFSTGAFKKNIDIAFCLDCESKKRLSDRFYENTFVIADESCQKEGENDATESKYIPLVACAQEVGGKIYTNTIVAGIILSLFNIDDEDFRKHLKKIFASKGEAVVENNMQATQKGKELGEEIKKATNIVIDIPHTVEKKKEVYIDGSQGVALGALAGGCNFVSSYPMSPSTGVLTLLASYATKNFDIAVEQVEDEITAINMALGAWYAGARALVTTSGGGFALMAEALSLSGMTENPVVIHLAQRPGPATGLPTRTEQGDLEFALYGGHGTFPRIILTPGTPYECFVATKKAMYFADKYQIPVIVMTDQFLLDSFYETDCEEMLSYIESKPQKFFVETDEKYKRYALTDDGLSPRGIPGFGEGFVHVDSDEHNEDGRIIEDAPTRNMMMEKRQYRIEIAREEAMRAFYWGNENPTFLVIGWGSTHGVILEVLKNIENKHIGYLHITQMHPLGEDVCQRVAKAKNSIVIENNMTGQCADLLERECKVRISTRITRYDGWPFSVEELQEELEELIS